MELAESDGAARTLESRGMIPSSKLKIARNCANAVFGYN